MTSRTRESLLQQLLQSILSQNINIYSIFRDIDKDGSGTLTSNEVLDVFRRVAGPPRATGASTISPAVSATASALLETPSVQRETL